MKDSPLNFSAYRTIPKILSVLLQRYEQGHFYSPERKETRESLSLWASLRSMATANINVYKLSLNWKQPFMGGHYFARGGGCRQQIHPSISQTVKEKWKLADPLDHLIVFSPCSNKLKTISRGTHSELLWRRGVSKYPLNSWIHILLVDILGQEVLLYGDVSPNSLIINAGPRLPASSCVISCQSSMSSSYLNHAVDPS